MHFGGVWIFLVYWSFSGLDALEPAISNATEPFMDFFNFEDNKSDVIVRKLSNYSSEFSESNLKANQIPLSASSNSFLHRVHIFVRKNTPCPRYCKCDSKLVQTCSRLDSKLQKFSSSVTELNVVDSDHPIELNRNFFLEIGLKNIESIQIVNSRIKSIDENAFNGLDKLFNLNFTNVNLTELHPDTFANNKNLRILIISGNDLSSMIKFPYLLKSSAIEELHLSHNNFTAIRPDAFSQLTYVSYLNLQGNNLINLPEKAFDSVRSIEQLDLSKNPSLTTLPNNIFQNNSLAVVRLQQNPQIVIDLSFLPSTLRELDLSFCDISNIDSKMFEKIHDLTHLVLCGNNLMEIESNSFATLRNLRYIDLSGNDIHQISSLAFYKNSDLKDLRLHNNPHLLHLPPDGFLNEETFSKITRLDLSNCGIGAIERMTFDTMLNLEVLNLASNNINGFDPITFAQLRKLYSLDLSNNVIAKLNNRIFENNLEIRKLNLHGNRLKKLSAKMLAPLANLVELDVSDCQLTTLITDHIQNDPNDPNKQSTFYDSLVLLNISSNQISEINLMDLILFKKLHILDVSTNPLQCDEDFHQFISYTNEREIITPAASVNCDCIDSCPLYQPRVERNKFVSEVCKYQELDENVDFITFAQQIHRILESFMSTVEIFNRQEEEINLADNIVQVPNYKQNDDALMNYYKQEEEEFYSFIIMVTMAIICFVVFMLLASQIAVNRLERMKKEGKLFNKNEHLKVAVAATIDTKPVKNFPVHV